MAGLTATGFDRLTLQEIKAALEADFQTLISSSLNVQADSVAGIMIGILSEQLSDVWELAEEVYNYLNPDAAEGVALDNIGAISGVTRLPATQGTATISCAGTVATALTAGRQITINDYVWELDAEVTIAASAVWAAGTAYAVGDYVENDTPDRIYYCTVAGTSAGAGGPTGTGSAIVDNTCTWRYVGEGAGVVEGAFTAVDYGSAPVGYSGNEATISTPVSGWNAAQFAVDSNVGRDEETDAAYRLRRQLQLFAQGNATEDAIRADILAVDDVTSCTMFVNNTGVVDGDNVPAHGFEAVVLGGAANDIAQAILDSKATGIEDYGTSSGTATDSEGNSETRYFTRPSEINIYVDYTVTTDGDFPTDGDDQIKAALVAFGNALAVGEDVIYTKLYDIIFNISGVVDVTLLEIGTAPAPAGTSNIAIGSREKSVWDTADITVI